MFDIIKLLDLQKRYIYANVNGLQINESDVYGIQKFEEFFALKLSFSYLSPYCVLQIILRDIIKTYRIVFSLNFGKQTICSCSRNFNDEAYKIVL